MDTGRRLFTLLCCVLLCGLSACFVPEAGDRSQAAAGRPNDAAGRAHAGVRIPEDVLKLPDMAQGFPGMAEALGDACWYLPYAVIDEAQGIALADALTELLVQGKPFPEKLEVATGTGAGGSNFLYPLREDVARMYYGDINDTAGLAIADSMIPVIIAQPEPGASDADVLFLDGHVEAVHVGRFPLSAGFLAALSALDTPEHAEKGK